MPETQHYDIVVVGGGPVGLSAAWNGARRGARVLVLERFGFMNELCGTSGAERHWRVQYTEEDLCRLTLQTLPMWRALEESAERKLIHEVGSLWFGDVDVHTNEGQISGTARMMDAMSVPYEWMTAAEIERRYGFTDLPRDYEGFLQRDGGVVDVRGTVSALFRLAQASGAVLRGDVRVRELVPDSDGVTVETSGGTYQADKVVLANGPWANELLRPLGTELGLNLFEMALVTLKRGQRAADAESPFWFLFQQPTEEDTNLFYGFPPNPWAETEELRVGPVFEVDGITSGYEATGRAEPRHVRRVCDWVEAHLPTVAPEPVRSSTCLAVLPADPNRQFFLGAAEGIFRGGENVVISTGGWGFKFVPLLGKICTELCLDQKTSYDIGRLALSAKQ